MSLVRRYCSACDGIHYHLMEHVAVVVDRSNSNQVLPTFVIRTCQSCAAQYRIQFESTYCYGVLLARRFVAIRPV